MSTSSKHAIIVGGGPCGSLAACFLGKRGWKVEIYEFREGVNYNICISEHPRTQAFVPGRSINLACSVRSRSALAAVGLEDTVVKNGVPMYARYIHPANVTQPCYPVPYGKKDQYILSVNRRELNELMLSEAEKAPGVKFYFGHKLIHCNQETSQLTLQRLADGEKIETSADLILACDGAFSAIRRSFLKMDRFDYCQEYFELAYIELNILPTNDNDFALPPNYFHLWPRGNFCLIALANQDKTFTVTLFAPYPIFENLDSEERICQFFEKYFPDAYKLIGSEAITQTFQRTKHSALVTIKCTPHNVRNVVLMGDAAHAMVPFYGQGLNCAFEDCLVLDSLLTKHNEDVEKTLEEYSRIRVADAHAICTLSQYNAQELTHLVVRKSFQWRKKLDAFLHLILGNSWIPLYSMVTFSRTRYHDVIENRKWQDKIVKRSGTFVIITAVSTLIGFALKRLVRNT